MPVPKRGPVWRSPSPETKRQESRRAMKCPHGKNVDDDDAEDEEMENEEAKQRHMNQISRHRDDVSVCALHFLQLQDSDADV